MSRFAPATASSARSAPAIFSASTPQANLNHSRMSVAIWSFRLRAVWSLAAAGTRFVSACSMFMWTSSSLVSQANLPAVISARMASSPE